MRYHLTLKMLGLLALFPAFPGALQASTPASRSTTVALGDSVLATGTLHRKCAAVVESIPSPGFAQLKFERAGCGDAAQIYELRQLQHLTFVAAGADLSLGDHVVMKGHFGANCAGRVSKLSRSGYVIVDFDTNLCADAASLFRSRDLTKISFVSESSGLSVGQRVSAPGIREEDYCKGEITRLTDNGLAQIHFEQLTCASAGKLFPLADLTLVKAAAKPKRFGGNLIFQRVMREIASEKIAVKRLGSR
jgi:hypothetical protein